MTSALLVAVTPNAAVLVLTAGVALIAVELNRPGLVLPGAGGLLMLLLSSAVLLARDPRPWSIALLIAGGSVLLLQLRRAVAVWAAALASIALIAGFLGLLPAGAEPRIHPAIAVVCAAVLAAGTTVLTRIARRARVNKGLD